MIEVAIISRSKLQKNKLIPSNRLLLSYYFSNGEKYGINFRWIPIPPHITTLRQIIFYLRKKEEIIRDVDILHFYQLFRKIQQYVLPYLKIKLQKPVVDHRHEFLLICINGYFYQSKKKKICLMGELQNKLKYFKCKEYCNFNTIQTLHYSTLIFSLSALYNCFIDFLIVPSNILLKWFKNAGYKRLTLIRNFVNTDIFKDTVEPTEYETNRLKLVFVGRLSFEKGLLEFLKGLQLVANDYPINFYVVGDGPLKYKIRQFITRYNLKKYVFFLGFKENPAAYFKFADIIIHPSIFWDLTPLALLEGMYTGNPILRSRFVGPEITELGYDLPTFNPYNPVDIKNKLEFYIENLEELRKRAKKGKRIVLKYFNPKIHMKKLKTLYRLLINQQNF